MIRILKKIISIRKESRARVQEKKERQALIQKVEKGADLVIREYGEALRKLGAYDRQ